MEDEKVKEILEELYVTLSEESKRCEPETLPRITEAMLNVYITLLPLRCGL